MNRVLAPQLAELIFFSTLTRRWSTIISIDDRGFVNNRRNLKLFDLDLDSNSNYSCTDSNLKSNLRRQACQVFNLLSCRVVFMMAQGVESSVNQILIFAIEYILWKWNHWDFLMLFQRNWFDHKTGSISQRIEAKSRNEIRMSSTSLHPPDPSSLKNPFARSQRRSFIQ